MMNLNKKSISAHHENNIKLEKIQELEEKKILKSIKQEIIK